MEDKIFLCELTLLSLHLFPEKKQLRFGLIVKKKNSSLIFVCVCVFANFSSDYRKLLVLQGETLPPSSGTHVK